MNSAVALHRQIYEEIRAGVLQGRLLPGARLPSSRQLSRELHVARTTVLQALNDLIAEGFLVTHAASSVCVAPELPLVREFSDARRISRQQAEPRLTAAARALLTVPSGAPRLGGAPRAFRPGVPALDLFPTALWAKISARCHARASTALLDGVESAGLEPLRQAIADHIGASRGVRCTAAQVFVTSGTQQAYDEILRLVLEPGAAVWVEDPGYLGVRRAVLAAGGRPVAVPVDREGLDVSAGIRRAPQAHAVFIAPSHQYPLGVTMSLSRRLALLAWAGRARAVVVEDDYDSEFRHHGRPLTALQGLDEMGCVVYVGTFSKTLFPGLRLGFLVVPPAFLPAFAAARATVSSTASVLEQAALAEFLQEGHFATHLRRMRVAYRERKAALLEALGRDCPGLLQPVESDTGIQLAAELDPRFSDVAVRAAAAARGVEVGPLSEYFLEPGGRNGLLFGFGGVRPGEMRAGTRVLAAALQAARTQRAGR